MTRRFNRRHGVTSVRGHVFGILASMVVGYYNPMIRDTRVLGHRPINPQPSVVNTLIAVPDDMNRRLGGYYSDLFAIALSAVAYMVLVLIVRFLARSRHQMYTMLMASLRTALMQTVKAQRTRASHNRIIGRRSFFSCQTDWLPSTCNTLWMIEGLTCGWSNDMFISMAKPMDGLSLVGQSRRDMLMNIVQMSEPLNFVRLRLVLNQQTVCTYMDVAPRRTFMTINKVSRDRVLAPENRDGKLEVVCKRLAGELSFHELMRIR